MIPDYNSLLLNLCLFKTDSHYVAQASLRVSCPVSDSQGLGLQWRAAMSALNLVKQKTKWLFRERKSERERDSEEGRERERGREQIRSI